jgi:hypothetical protein
MIADKLESVGCRIVEKVGIWTVTTPAGELWNFTRPEMVDENGKAIQAKTLLHPEEG